MSTPEYFMKRAIKLSREKMISQNAAPFAALVVKHGQIIGEGVNEVFNKSDPTSHGEVEAIRMACSEIKDWDLSGCELYTTCEPCELCASLIFWSKIDRVYYANTLEAARDDFGFDNLDDLRDEVRKDTKDRTTPYNQILQSEAREVLDEWATTDGFRVFK
jgi:guanine deaminase